MPKIFKMLLTPRDVGMERFTAAEIAERMTPVDDVDAEPLMDFACTVSAIMDGEECPPARDNPELAED